MVWGCSEETCIQGVIAFGGSRYRAGGRRRRWGKRAPSRCSCLRGSTGIDAPRPHHRPLLPAFKYGENPRREQAAKKRLPVQGPAAILLASQLVSQVFAAVFGHDNHPDMSKVPPGLKRAATLCVLRHHEHFLLLKRWKDPHKDHYTPLAASSILLKARCMPPSGRPGRRPAYKSASCAAAAC